MPPINNACGVGQKNGVRTLSNGVVELGVPAAYGPRIMRYAFVGEENVLGETDAVIDTKLGRWRARGGHRLWAAPESRPFSFSPDDEPVEMTGVSEMELSCLSPVDPNTGLQKELSIRLDAEGSGATVRHRLVNRGSRVVRVAPWAITILRGGGEVIVPQEPFKTWEEDLSAARALALWHYTDLSDPRWRFFKKYLVLRCDPDFEAPQKIGAADSLGWAAYRNAGIYFVKRFAYEKNRDYPDRGCNLETYTAGSLVELESLGYLRELAPGESAAHEEKWFLFRAETETLAEAAVDAFVNSHLRDFGQP